MPGLYWDMNADAHAHDEHGDQNKYTVYAQWDAESYEELDVLATTESGARAVAEMVLEQDYEPGWRIVQVTERIPGTMYF